MHTCKHPGCNNPVFGGGFCKYDQFRRSMRGGDKYKAKSKQNNNVEPLSSQKSTKIPKESKRRKSEHIYYSAECKLLEKEIRNANNGKIYDFFTGREIKGNVTWHHILGRTGDFYLDKDLLVPAENDENDGHLFYHRATVEQLIEKEWYGSFLDRLKQKSMTAYNKELKKQDKNLRISFE